MLQIHLMHQLQRLSGSGSGGTLITVLAMLWFAIIVMSSNQIPVVTKFLSLYLRPKLKHPLHLITWRDEICSLIGPHLGQAQPRIH